jgi:acyl dehydratase
MPDVVAPPRAIAYADLPGSLGVSFGPTPWTRITQPQVDAFADVTHDHQWIHVDEERARHGPVGATIAHGYLTLSRVPFLLGRLLEVTGVWMAVSYGRERVRFPAPVPVGGSLQASAEIAGVQARPKATQGDRARDRGLRPGHAAGVRGRRRDPARRPIAEVGSVRDLTSAPLCIKLKWIQFRSRKGPIHG